MNTEYRPSRELKALLVDLTDGELGAAQRRRLNELLGSDEEARRYYVELTTLHAMLELRHRGSPLVNLPLAEPAPLVPRSGRNLTWLAGACLAAALLVLVAFGLNARRIPQPHETRPDVVTLVEGEQIEWDEGGGPDASGGLRPGHGSLPQGTTHIHLSSGVQIAVQGPSRFELLRENTRFRLHRGTIRVHVPPAATGFTVLAGRAEIVDLGTEFGVFVAADDDVEVHVFAGHVRVNQEVDMHEGEVQRFDHSGQRIASRLTADAFPALRP